MSTPSPTLKISHEDFQQTLEALVVEYQKASAATLNEMELRAVYARFGGKEGQIRAKVTNALQKALPDEKKAIGQIGNSILHKLEGLFKQQIDRILLEEKKKDLARSVDVTLPGRSYELGALHPITEIRRLIVNIFKEIGFLVATGNQVETDFFNFQALAMPENHPARSMQDTFYLPTENLLLRTHTSAVQIHTMIAQDPPIRIIAPGKVYRKEDDPTHSPMFNQLEGLVVDQNITFADLKGTLLYFVKRLFGEQTQIRLRASFFPFVEPGAELDILCYFCKGTGTGCRTCKGSGYIEVLGCGMVHPEVFHQVNQKRIPMGKAPMYHSTNYPGFAFGMGLDRLAMLYYGIDDLKIFFSGDVRLQKQLGSLQ